MRSLFPYIGGKHKVAVKLAAILPEHKCYVEVFMGAANILFAKQPSACEVINDINGDLVNLFRVVRWHPGELLDELTYAVQSRKEFNDYHEQPGLTDIQRAARFWYILRTTFGGQGVCKTNCFNTATIKKGLLRHNSLDVINEAHIRLDGVIIENLDFEKLIAKYDRPHTVLFCDPPYWQAVKYGRAFDWSDQIRLSKILKNIKGKFILTINNHKDIRPLYKWANIRKFPMTYSICKNVHKEYELLISNFTIKDKLW